MPVPGVVLIVTRTSDALSDSLEAALRERSCPVFRFHPDDFPVRAAISLVIDGTSIAGTIDTEHGSIELSAIKAAWYGNPGRPTLAEQLPEQAVEFCRMQSTLALRTLYGAIGERWLVNPQGRHVAGVRVAQLARAARLGFAIPTVRFTNDPKVAGKLMRHDRRSRWILEPADAGAWAGIVGTPVVPEDTTWSSRGPTFLRTYPSSGQLVQAAILGDLVVAAEVSDGRSIPGSHDLGVNTASALVELVRGFGIGYALATLELSAAGAYTFVGIEPGGDWRRLQSAGIPVASLVARALDEGYPSALRVQ